MNFLLPVGIFAIASAPLLFADNASKVKLVSLDGSKCDGEYLIDYNNELVKINDTYNRLDISYDVAKNLPLDMEFIVQLFRSASDCANFEKINDYTVTLCTDEKHEHFECLPDEWIDMFNLGKWAVLPLGHYEFQGHGTFKFDKLLSEEELSDACFKYIATVKSKDHVILEKQYTFVSNEIE